MSLTPGNWFYVFNTKSPFYSGWPFLLQDALPVAFVTNLKNELLCWHIKTLCVLHCGRLKTLQDSISWWAHRAGHVGLGPSNDGASSKDLCSIRCCCYFFCSFMDPSPISENLTLSIYPISQTLMFQLHFHLAIVSLIFISIFPLSCLRLISPAPLWDPYNTAHSASSDITSGFLPSHPLISW